MPGLMDRVARLEERMDDKDARIAALEAELAAERGRRGAAEKDAARYRWLRDRWFMPFSALPWCGPDGYTGDLDAAIDAAMND